ncbi:hypothetical protein FA15DRAFT_708260 [Coprinopsis marcescibilis]|uniref:F-box domain-containing protein n=1 Tax=Coprinopsis marcescibilis TaxID=230819 RepID=A0A5C3KJL0_COPMA|nr:hypothetical protein FA15DRAFT_708260 [Coprinopsis marcescibilis]
MEELPAESFPVLEDLVYVDSPSDSSAHDRVPTQAFANSTSLRRVAVYGNDFNSWLPLPWKHISHLLTFGFLMDTALWNNTKPSLELHTACFHLDWRNYGYNSGLHKFRDAPVQSLSRLQHLTFLCASPYDVEYPHFFFNFDFPNLRAIRFVSSKSVLSLCETGAKAAFLNKLQALTHLAYLSLVLKFIPSATAEELFQSTPYLETLDVETPEDCSRLFHLLTLQADNPDCVLPNLKTLVLELHPCSQLYPGPEGKDVINASGLCSFVQSRRQREHGQQLQRIILYSSDKSLFSHRQPYIACLQPFVEEGLAIEYRLHDQSGSTSDVRRWAGRDPGLEDWREGRAFFDWRGE